MTSAEQAYLFRHALLRDAAYDLLVPAVRAALHVEALHAIEGLCGGRPPALPPWRVAGRSSLAAHPSDVFARELAWHAVQAERLSTTTSSDLNTTACLYLRRAAEHAEQHYRSQEAAACWVELADLLSGELRGEALCRGSTALRASGITHAAEPMLKQALALASRHESEKLEVVALSCLASLWVQVGRLADAEVTAEQGLDASRRAKDRRGEGVLLSTLAIVARQGGNLELAENLYLQSLQALREAGDQRAEAATLGNLVIVYQQLSRREATDRTYGQVLELCHETGDRPGLGIALGNLATHHRESGRLEDAEHTFLEALTICRETGNRRSEGVVTGNLATLYRDTGRLDLARQGLVRALAIHREVGNPRFEGIHLLELALLQLQELQAVPAALSWHQGAVILLAIGNRRTLEDFLPAMRQACARAGVPPFDGPEQRQVADAARS